MRPAPLSKHPCTIRRNGLKNLLRILVQSRERVSVLWEWRGLLVNEKADVFCCDLCRAVYVLWNGDDCLVNPCGGLTRCRAQRRTKSAGGAEEDEALNLCAELGCFFEKNEGACDVCVDKVLLGVALDMWLVKRRCVKDMTDLIVCKNVCDEGAIVDGSYMVSVL
ncbi:hypothetical protein HG531_012459 [Fusarium graminearum]|nr:hypothetical protein HG531_012459 [Fusarium graminearum]